MSKRAANMGSIRKRPDGRWEGRYTASDGKQHSVYGKTQAACASALRAAQNDVDNGHWLQPSQMTVKEWFEIFLRDYQAHTTQRTRHVYGQIARLHIVPVIGDVKVSRLTPMHVRRVVNAMVEKGLSPNYIHHAHGVLSVAMNAAVESGLVKQNPAENIKTPPRNTPKFNIVDRDLLPQFIEAASHNPNGNILIFAILTGLRAGELRGLKWSAIDFDKSSMDVCRQLQTHIHAAFTPPKYNSSRVVELTSQSVALLKKQRKDLAALRLAAGDRWESNEIVDDLVFRSATGHFIAESVLHKAAREVGAEIGIPELHPHDLRHSYAVAAIRSGVDIKTVQHNLGHKSAAMTLDVYAAYTADAGKAGAKMLSAYWGDVFDN
jgi:integrase